MEIKDLGKEIANGLINTGIESDFGGISCSTGGDYLSLGVQQLEGSRADELLGMLTGGDTYIGRKYSDFTDDELRTLSSMLASDEGVAAQMSILTRDAKRYAQVVIDAGLTDARCVIYAGMWCPTSEDVVSRFIQNRIDRNNGAIAENLTTLDDLFYDEYADAADCSDYLEGYQNRAVATYNYVRDLDLSSYGL
jgi:hypothetical protein